jgi:pimeloyl-ACP methyl ester carboxylesterase
MTSAAAAGTRRELDLAGCSVRYQRGGSGVPLLYLHGGFGVAGWMPWMERLAATHDLIVPDHPGWGQSPLPPWLDNIHDLAYFYLDFMRALELERVHLVGHSLGGWLAAEIAVRSTERLATLTLVAPAGLRAPGVQKFDVFLATHEATTRAAFHDQTFADQALAQPLDGDALDVHLQNRFALARVGWQPRLYDPHLHKWLHRIDIPTLVLWGADDRIVPIAHSVEFTSRIPGARSAVIAACGHSPHIEAVDAFVTAVAGQISASPGA